MAEKKLGIELKPGTGWATAWAAAPAALAGFQAASAQRQLGKVRTDIDNYRRQDIENPFANLSNPYENLAVATQAAEIKMEQTDQALANTLDQINQSGTGAGAATALARMAAASKAQVGASIENQEVQNQKLRAEGDAQVSAQKMQLEQAAIGEETAAWGRQEGRDLASMDRLAGQGENAQAAAMGYQAQGDAALMAGMTTAASAFTGGGMEGFEGGGSQWDGFGVTT